MRPVHEKFRKKILENLLALRVYTRKKVCDQYANAPDQ